MKTSIHLLISILILISGCSKAAPPPKDSIKEVWLGLSPFYPTAEHELIRKEVTKFILQATPGTRVFCYDAWNLRLITRFEIPVLLRDTSANRAERMKEQLVLLTAWFADKNASASADLKGTAALNHPDSLFQMTMQSKTGEKSIVLVGAPFFFSPKEPAFSMIQNGVPLIPNDAHLFTNRLGSVYGTSELSNRLASAAVRFCYLSEAVWSNSFHMVEVRRFWRGYIGLLQGGVMAGFSPDLATLLASAQNREARPVCDFELDRRMTRPAMRVAAAPDLPIWMNPVQANSAVSRVRYSTNATTTIAASAIARLPQPRAGKIGIGIMWSQQADIDLYVRPKIHSAELSYQRPVTTEGVYHYDYRHANQDIDYEYVELHSTQVNFDDLEAWANFYAGNQPSIQGAVCVHYGGETYYGSFTITASHGNGGADAANRHNSRFWAHLDIAKIVGLAPN